MQVRLVCGIITVPYQALFVEKEERMSEKRKDKRGRILRTGESQRPNLTYQYRYKDIRGNTHYVYAPTLEELRAKEAVIQKDVTDGIDYCAGETTVLELIERYVSQKQGVRYNTKVGYNFVKNLVKEEDFGYRKIKTIKPSDAKQWLIKLHDDGYKYSTLTTVRGVLKPAFEMAVEDDVVRRNPFLFRVVDVVPNDTVPRKALTKDEQRKLLEYVQSDKCRSRHYDEIVILLGTGVRISELYGLTKSDVDFQNGVVRIERQLTRTRNSEYYIEKPKTESGFRLIPMSAEVRQAFQNVISKRKIPKVETIVGGHIGFLFLDKDGKPKVAGHLEHAMKRIVDNYNKSHNDKLVVTPHILRHTFCTEMAQAGMPVKELQYLMGHSDVGTTMNIYTHSSFDAAKQAFEKIAASR